MNDETHSTAPWKFDRKKNQVVSAKSKKPITTLENLGFETEPNGALIEASPDMLNALILENLLRNATTVSYTHLTLPTKA